MRKISFIATICYCLLSSTYYCTAQSSINDTGISDYTPCYKVIFEDHFGKEKPGSFPEHWEVRPCNSYAYTLDRYCRVTTFNNESYMCIDGIPEGLSGERNASIDNEISPVMPSKKYLPDTFSLEYDLILSAKNTVTALYLSHDACLVDMFSLSNKNGSSWLLQRSRTERSYYLSATPNTDAAIYTSPHHFALLYENGTIKCYIDQRRIAVIPNCEYSAQRFALSCVSDTVKYTNVRLATGHFMPAVSPASFNALLKEKNFVTNAIHFETNSAVITSDGLVFLYPLAAWLYQHTDVLLEIDGHTDNDGDSSSNMRLSQARANEVKKQLVKYGINETRLAAKGYGATKPIQTDNTPDSKAKNRRVEFIKQ